MDKTYNIGLGGFSFSIEDSAYNKLKNYLAAVRTQLKNNEDREEIIADVEYRMAELLKERLKIREVVNMEDVNYIISTMGTPEAYNELDDSTSGSQEQTSSKNTTTTSLPRKKLFRDPDYRVLGGVCSGLGYYFGIDKTWIRLGLICLPFLDVLFLGVSTLSVFLIYAILWIIVPKALTTSEKLQMRGEAVNVDSIREFSESYRRTPDSGESFFLKLIKIVFKIVGILFLLSFLFSFICSLVLIVFIASIFITGRVSSFGISDMSWLKYLPVLLNNQVEVWLAYISIFFVVVLPLIGIILLAISLMSNRFKVDRKVTYGILSAFFVNLIMLIIIGGLTLKNFSAEKTMITKKEINIPSDTLVINNVTDFEGERMNNTVELKNNKYAYKREYREYLFVKPTNDSIPYFEIELFAKGKNKEDAEKNLSKIHYAPRIVGNNIYLDDFLSLDKNTKWRNQEVSITLFLPEGKYVRPNGFSNLVERKGEINEYHNQDFHWRKDRVYGFVNGKFTCVSCPREEDIKEALEKKSEYEEKDHEIKIKVDSANNRKKVEINAGPIKMKIEE